MNRLLSAFDYRVSLNSPLGPLSRRTCVMGSTIAALNSKHDCRAQPLDAHVCHSSHSSRGSDAPSSKPTDITASRVSTVETVIQTGYEPRHRS